MNFIFAFTENTLVDINIFVQNRLLPLDKQISGSKNTIIELLKYMIKIFHIM